MNFTMPDRNVLIGALAALIVGLITILFEQGLGLTIPTAMAESLPVLVGFVIAHFIPLSTSELVKKLDDDVVHAAQVDPTSNVSYVIPPVPVPAGEAPTIIPPDVKEARAEKV